MHQGDVLLPSASADASRHQNEFTFFLLISMVDTYLYVLTKLRQSSGAAAVKTDAPERT